MDAIQNVPGTHSGPSFRTFRYPCQPSARSTPKAFVNSVRSARAAVQATLARKKSGRSPCPCVHIHSEVGASGLADRGLRAAAALTLLAAASTASAVMLTAYAFVLCPRARRPLWTCSTASRYGSDHQRYEAFAASRSPARGAGDAPSALRTLQAATHAHRQVRACCAQAVASKDMIERY